MGYLAQLSRPQTVSAVWERDQRPTEKWSSQGRTSRTGDAASDITYTPTLQHAIQTQYCLCTPQLLHTRETTSAMLNSIGIAATHNTTHSPYTSTCTIHPALSTPLPSIIIPPMHKTYRIAGKFDEVFNLANWRICGKSPNLKPANI